MGCSHEKTKVYKRNPDSVYRAFLKAIPLLDNKIQIESEDSVARQIAARIPMGMFSPTAIRVMIGSTSDNGASVYVSSRFIITSLFDWGRNKKIVDKLIQTADTILSVSQG